MLLPGYSLGEMAFTCCTQVPGPDCGPLTPNGFMIISRTPFRISFFGGGTDYPTWYREHGGTVLATTINKYCYLTCRYLPPFFEHRLRIAYSRIETCQHVDEI